MKDHTSTTAEDSFQRNEICTLKKKTVLSGINKNCTFENRNGPEWHRLRQPLQRPINLTENIRHYVSDVDQVACEFVEDVAESVKTKKKSSDFLQELSQVFLECNLKKIFYVACFRVNI